MVIGAAMERKATKERGMVDRVRVVMSLANGDRTVLPQAVRRYLSDPSPRVRSAALDVVREEDLGEMNEEVLRLLSDKSRTVRDQSESLRDPSSR
jgi:hypothetical protein